MDTTIDQQVAMDEALVPHAKRLNVLEIYMQEFWATSTVHHHSIQFKMDNKKHIVNLESFRHSAVIKKLTDVNINKLHQPWRAFAAIINKCLTGKSLGYDSLRLNTKIQRREMRCIILDSRRHQNTQQFDTLLPIELTNEDIRNSNAYKEYYAVSTKATPPKPKASTHISQASGSGANEGTGSITGVPDVPTDEYEEEISWNSIDEEGDDDKGKDGDDDKEGNDDDDQEDEGDDGEDDEEDEETRDEESFDHIPKTPKNSDDEGNGEEDLDLNVGREEGHNEKEEEDELYRDVNINQRREANFSEFMQTNQFARAVSAILGIVQRYMDQRMNEAVKVAVQLQSNQLRDEAQADNDEFLKTIDENMKKIIKEQVKEQVKTSYVVVADLSEMELKKILIEKIEGNKETVMLKRRLDDDADKDEEPSTSASESATVDEPMQTTFELEDPTHPEFETGVDDQPIVESIQPWIRELAKQSDSRSSFNELMDTTVDFSNFLMNRLRVDILTPKLLSGPTYELMKGSCKSLVELEYQLEEVYKATTDQLDWVNPEGQQYPHNLLKPLPLIPNNRVRRVIPFDHFINNKLEYLRGGASNRKYTTYVTKTKAADYEHIKWIKDLFYSFAVNWESARDVYSKRRIIVVTELKIVEWHNYKHLDWITYLSQSIWRKSDKDRAATMIQAIDKRLKTRRIMRSLERFVGGRLYEGDFRML
nr:hypothetical protein [Tanacetum cinerariifolium]